VKNRRLGTLATLVQVIAVLVIAVLVIAVPACRTGKPEQGVAAGGSSSTASSSTVTTGVTSTSSTLRSPLRPIPRPVELVRQDLARRLGVQPSDVEVVEVVEEVWPDTCLGVPAPELCAPGPTPGYRVAFRVNGREYRFHTDLGTVFRFAGPGEPPPDR